MKKSEWSFRQARTEAILEWMTLELRPFLVRPELEGGIGWEKVDCIRTSKIAIAFLRSFGICARPLSVVVRVANQTLGKKMRQQGKDLLDLSIVDVKEMGGYVCRMGRVAPQPDPPGQWRGHLVLGVENEWFLDLTLDSVNDKRHLFELNPVYIKTNKTELDKLERGEQDFIVDFPAGEQVVYTGDPKNQDYRNKDAWIVWGKIHDHILEWTRAKMDR